MDESQYENFLLNIKQGTVFDSNFGFKIEYLNIADKSGFLPIHWACFYGHLEILKILLKKCDIETLSKNGWKPIHCASLIGYKKIVKFLIKSFCEINCLTDDDKSPLDIAAGTYGLDYIDRLFYHDRNFQTAFAMGLKCGSVCSHSYCFKSVATCQFNLKEELGTGFFGKTFKIYNDEINKPFACKKIKFQAFHIKSFSENILPIINEFRFVITHDKLIKYFGMIESSKQLLIIMELMDKGSLENIIRSKLFLSEDQILRYSKDILEALHFLHKTKIIHRRVKPTHMLIDHNDVCKLSISSLSRTLFAADIREQLDLTNMYPGVMNFLAPEIINDEPYNLPVDIWSFGCSLIYMASKTLPNSGLDEFEMCFEIGTKHMMQEEYCLDLYSNITDHIKRFIKQILVPCKKLRPTAKFLLENNIFRNISSANNIKQSVHFHNSDHNNEGLDLINYAINNRKIGLSLDFQCHQPCDHKLCLSSITATNFSLNRMNSLGQGGFGKVYKMKKTNSNEEFAIKVVETQNIVNVNCLECDINKYKDELCNERIIRYYCGLRDEEKIYILMEYMENGSLKNFLKLKKSLDVTTIQRFSKQILEGMAFLHKKGIIHRDIKSENILLDQTGDLKICDFGFSRFYNSLSAYYQIGTPGYMSPEMVANKSYDLSTDIWSVGILIQEMASKLNPNSKQSKSLEKFVNLMLKEVPNKRPLAADLLKHKFIRSNNFDHKLSLKTYLCFK